MPDIWEISRMPGYLRKFPVYPGIWEIRIFDIFDNCCHSLLLEMPIWPTKSAHQTYEKWPSDLWKSQWDPTNMSNCDSLNPSNNFTENPRKFPGIFPGNQRKFPGIFHRKIQWKCRQLFPGISHNPFQGTRSEEFLVTHSEEILVTLSKEFLVTNSREFPVSNSSEKPEKIFSEKVFRTNSWEFPGNYSQDFLKSSSGKSWNIH